MTTDSRRYKTISTAALKSLPMSTPPNPTKRIGMALTWDVCIAHEPRLLNVVRRIDAIKQANEVRNGTRRLRYSYALKCWYGQNGRRAIKADLNDIIGWHGDTAYNELRTS